MELRGLEPLTPTCQERAGVTVDVCTGDASRRSIFQRQETPAAQSASVERVIAQRNSHPMRIKIKEVVPSRGSQLCRHESRRAVKPAQVTP